MRKSGCKREFMYEIDQCFVLYYSKDGQKIPYTRDYIGKKIEHTNTECSKAIV